MIELTFSTAFMLYLGFTLLSIFGTGLFSQYRMRKKILFSNQQTLFKCEFCHNAYVEETGKEFNRCPQCFLINKKNPYSY